MIKATVNKGEASIQFEGDKPTIITELVGLVAIVTNDMTDSILDRDKMIDIVIECINSEVRGKDIIEKVRGD